MSIEIVGPQDTERAAEVLRAGGLVGLPTETVYGLAANAASPEAVARIYQVKGRPNDHPVIVHLAKSELIQEWAINIPEYAWKLAERFWPGPMTLILPKADHVGIYLTGGQDTVGLRVPGHPVARAILEAAGLGVAAPSANQFGSVSPTSAMHVLADIGNRLDGARDVIVDGGECEVGIESTIIDCTGVAPRILRPGFISQADIEEITITSVNVAPETIKAPGLLESHYAPHAKVLLAHDYEELEVLCAEPCDTRVGVIASEKIPTPRGAIRLAMPATSAEYAQNLYAALRTADELGLAKIVALLPTGDDVAVGIRDRLTRAAH